MKGRGYFLTLAIASSAALLAFVLPRPDHGPEVTFATPQLSLSYDIEVLPSRSQPSTTHENVRQTSGWHGDDDPNHDDGRFEGVDFAWRSKSTKTGANPTSDSVHAIFRVVKSNPNISAEVRRLLSPHDWCSGVQVVIKERVLAPDGTVEFLEIAHLHYLHVIPSVSVFEDVPLVGGADAKKLGEIIYFALDGCTSYGDQHPQPRI